MVVDKDNAEPLYFRYMAGNIVDVVTLKTTIQELGVMNIAANYALIDAGYYSEDNITALYEAEIAFLTRLPSNRVLFKDVVNQTALSLENAEKFVRYGDRALYVEKVEVKIFDKYIGFAYVCCDIKRKAEEIKKILFDAEENNSPIEETKLELTKAGIFVLLSSIEIKTHDVLPLYYLRQSAEQIFHVSKSYADILPLRVHTESAFRGVLMLNFIAVVLFINFRKQIPENITAETTLKIMRNMMCKVFDNNELITSEPNKKQRLILDSISNTVGKFSGV